MAPSIDSRISTLLTLLSTSIADLSSSSPSAPPTSAPAPTPTLIEIRSDLLALLSFLGKEATSLSLAFKPPVSDKAVEGTLDKLHGLVLKLVFCLSEAKPRDGALAKEINWIGLEALEAIQRLLESSLEGYKLGGKDAKKEKEIRQANLNLTGAVWEVVERSKGLSADELQALRKEWVGVLGMVDDCLEEVKEMEQSGDAEEEDEEEDEDEDEDDFRTSHPLSSTEKQRVTAAHFLLRLGRLLLNRLINSTAPPSPLPAFSTPSFLSQSSAIVQALSAASDDFALGLEPPQEDVGEVMHEFVQTVKKLAGAFEGAVEGNQGEEKWLKVWSSQLETAVQKLEAVGA